MYIYLSIRIVFWSRGAHGVNDIITLCANITGSEIQRSTRVNTAQYNDVKAHCANVTGSMKLCSAKLQAFGHYFCCAIP